jgi:hypothetical protein
MNRKLSFITLIFILLTTVSFSQNNVEDVVYLKNGSIIRGQIVEQKIGETIKIELLGGSIFVFKQEEIDSIKKEKAFHQPLQKTKSDYYRRDKGYRNFTEMGLICGFGTNNNGQYYYAQNRNDYGFSIRTTDGYQWSRYLFTGAGVGIDRFITYKQTFSPFYFRVASEFLKKRVTPYAFTDIGYAVMWKFRSDDYTIGKNKGGVYFSAGGGVRIFTRSHASVLFNVSYRLNKSASEWTYAYEGSPVYNLKRTYQRVVFGIGVSF